MVAGVLALGLFGSAGVGSGGLRGSDDGGAGGTSNVAAPTGLRRLNQQVRQPAECPAGRFDAATLGGLAEVAAYLSRP